MANDNNVVLFILSKSVTEIAILISARLNHVFQIATRNIQQRHHGNNQQSHLNNIAMRVITLVRLLVVVAFLAKRAKYFIFVMHFFSLHSMHHYEKRAINIVSISYLKNGRNKIQIISPLSAS